MIANHPLAGARVLLFGDERSPHVHKWSGFLEEAGASVDLVGYGEGVAPDSFTYKSLVARGSSASTVLGRIGATLADLRLLLSPRHDAASFHFLSDRYAFYALATRKPVVLTCWGSDILVDLRRAKGLSRALRLAALRRADRITADSEEVLEEIARAAPTSAERSRLVFWGVDAERFSEGGPGAPDLRAELGIPAGAIVLLSNRLCSPHYQVEKIVERFAAAIEAPDIYLVVRAQPGCDPEYLGRCKKAAGAARNVRFLGRPLADLELPALYRSADIVLHYPKTDATPVSMLEAFSCGRAVLCADFIASYERLAADYAMERAPLEALDEAAARRIAKARPHNASVNRAALLRLHSRQSSVEAVAEVFGEAMAARRRRGAKGNRGNDGR